VLLLDAVQQARPWPVPVVGLLDEPAHLATAWLALAALTPRLPRRVWLAALVASVAVDVDHVPLYLTDGAFSVSGGRPPTHSLFLVAALAAPALLLRAHWLLGAAAGVLLHLVRDVATGPGVPLLWPASEVTVRVPYAPYAVVLLVLAVTAAARARPAPIRR
jgi:inner membrane protein